MKHKDLIAAGSADNRMSPNSFPSLDPTRRPLKLQKKVRVVKVAHAVSQKPLKLEKELGVAPAACGKAALVATELPKEVGADMTTPEMNKERLNVQQRIGDCVKSRASGQGAAEAPERGAVVMATQVAKEVQKKVDDGPAALRKIIEKKLEEMVPGQWQPGFAVFLKPSNHAKQKDYVPLVESSAFKAQLEGVWHTARRRKSGQAGFVLELFVYIPKESRTSSTSLRRATASRIQEQIPRVAAFLQESGITGGPATQNYMARCAG
ncbi:uncharacterized protein PITG_02641 [Phytophthora infestans T30-4]|uniref:Uncharacterized protein n=1 Tax=Phytophthora infestans (strain T30-4) TaxID=403677 RepID=D0MWV0_PHYIT|nr:uncharacterized protein PITG_02641 [Phytophthora infestans T30-4]EEY64113.1 conserved hypothetical protein [Phytophthora infestans T30-4]|eukprot:XP_002907549.1 conserved hypothetical protein [Phytophthora infestans T30-4]